jgi:hypothetical protein
MVFPTAEKSRASRWSTPLLNIRPVMWTRDSRNTSARRSSRSWSAARLQQPRGLQDARRLCATTRGAGRVACAAPGPYQAVPGALVIPQARGCGATARGVRQFCSWGHAATLDKPWTPPSGSGGRSRRTRWPSRRCGSREATQQQQHAATADQALPQLTQALRQLVRRRLPGRRAATAAAAANRASPHTAAARPAPRHHGHEGLSAKTC